MSCCYQTNTGGIGMNSQELMIPQQQHHTNLSTLGSPEIYSARSANSSLHRASDLRSHREPIVNRDNVSNQENNNPFNLAETAA